MQRDLNLGNHIQSPKHLIQQVIFKYIFKMKFSILSDKRSIEINEKYFEMCTFSSTKEVENI